MKKIPKLFFLLPLVVPSVIFAASMHQNPLGIQINGSALDNVPDLLLVLARGFVVVMSPIIVVFIIYAGFLFVTARGNESQLEKARFILLWSLIGAFVLIAAEVISYAIQDTITSLT